MGHHATVVTACVVANAGVGRGGRLGGHHLLFSLLFQVTVMFWC